MPQEVYIRNLCKIETEQVARALDISQATAKESMHIPMMRKQLLSRALLMTLTEVAPEYNAVLESSLDLSSIPLSVQEELQLNQTLLLKE